MAGPAEVRESGGVEEALRRSEEQMRLRERALKVVTQGILITDPHRLERQGYQVVLAVTGQEAVAKFQSEKPDLGLMHINLPELDGLEAKRRIKPCRAPRSCP
jgi:response regulator RpfG family c-di-GMP phosphodiesterase